MQRNTEIRMRGNTTIIVVRVVRTHGYVFDISMLRSSAIENAFMLMMMAHFTSWAKRVCVFLPQDYTFYRLFV